jgi:hypothetical protein
VKDQLYQQKLETGDAWFRHILDATTCTKGTPDEAIQATSWIHRRARMRTEAEGDHSEQFLQIQQRKFYVNTY